MGAVTSDTLNCVFFNAMKERAFNRPPACREPQIATVCASSAEEETERAGATYQNTLSGKIAYVANKSQRHNDRLISVARSDARPHRGHQDCIPPRLNRVVENVNLDDPTSGEENDTSNTEMARTACSCLNIARDIARQTAPACMETQDVRSHVDAAGVAQSAM